jgi:DNA polymerase III alpha subunit
LYIELHASSAFSFLDGASLPEALVDRAAELGYPAIALLDRDGVYGIPRFHLAAKRAKLKAIVGSELSVSVDCTDPGLGVRDSGFAGRRARSSNRESRAPNPEPRRLTLPVLVASREGYRNLCRLVTQMKLRSPKGEGSLTLDELDGNVGGLVALAGRPAINAARFGVGGLIDRLVGTFGADNVCVELQRHLLRDEESDNHALLDLASAFHLPVIATNGVRFAEPIDRPLYDVLTCIRHKTTLERAGRRLTCNAERYLKSPEAMARLFHDLPAAIVGTCELADRLDYTMSDLGYRFPDYPVPPGETMASFLRKITQAGARERYRPYHDRARRQVERELDLIEKLDLAGYFLIVWDIVNYCRQHDILVQGRGSAANSAVCYSLGITAVDPVGMDLLFERFLSEERGEWPDIDIDLPSGDRREQVIQHVYEKYGKLGGKLGAGPEGPKLGPEGPRVGMTANVITYRGRSAAREVGKVLSLEPEQIDRLAKIMNHFEWVDPKETLERNLRDVGLDYHHPTIQLFGQLWTRIQDLPRHLGQHSGGMVICHGRLDEIVPLENASMPDRVVIQWDKDDCADMGLIKVDLLGLGMMAVLQDALHLVNSSSLGAPAAGAEGESSSPQVPGSGGGAPRPKKMMAVLQDALHLVNSSSGVRDSGPGVRSVANSIDSGDFDGFATAELQVNLEPRIPNHESRIPNPEHRTPAEIDLAHLPPNDPAVYKMLQEADTVGIFQVESRAQMATLPRLRPACFYDIVVEVAIIRPGPIVGQMVHPYLKRRRGAEPVTYPHPSLEPILNRTLGVPLFQEQLLRMAMVAAGFSGGEAEELRRAFGFKRSEKRMQQIETKLRAGMARQGITGDAAEEIIRSITSFALYGFPESHAASFALLVYASAYLKAHYPAAFFTAMLNNQPMGFYHPATLVKDAQRHGVRFAPIDVQQSDWECRVEPDGRVRLGLMYVNGLRQEVGKLIASGDRGPGAGDRGPGTGSSVVRGLGSSEMGANRNVPVELATVIFDRCPKCGCDDRSMIEGTPNGTFFCNICAHEWRTDCEASNDSSMASRTPISESRTPDPSPRSPEPERATELPSNFSQCSRGPTPARPPSAGSRLGRAAGAATDPQVPGFRSPVPGPRPPVPGPRFASIEDLIARTGLRRDELATLAEIGALNAFGHDRRSALWQIERAAKPPGELFESVDRDAGVRGSGLGIRDQAVVPTGVEIATTDALDSKPHVNQVTLADDAASSHEPRTANPDPRIPMTARASELRTPNPESRIPAAERAPDPRIPNPESRRDSPLRPMTQSERLMADYAGTSLTIGPHPLALRRGELAMRGVLRARDLPHDRHGRRVRVVGAVITRQRPGTAKGFVFLTLEDETGIANIIVRPDLFSEQRAAIVGEPYLLVEGTLQIQEGVTSIKAERVLPLSGAGPDPQSHDFR